MNKSRHVTFRCTQEQYDELKAQAKFAESTLSAYIVDNLCPRQYQISEHHISRERQLEKRYNSIDVPCKDKS